MKIGGVGIGSPSEQEQDQRTFVSIGEHRFEKRRVTVPVLDVDAGSALQKQFRASLGLRLSCEMEGRETALVLLVRIRAVIEQDFHCTALVSQGRIHEGRRALPIRFVGILAAPESLSEDLGSFCLT